jgi:hypothetical protein
MDGSLEGGKEYDTGFGGWSNCAEWLFPFFYLKLKLVANSRDLRREKGKVKMIKILVAIFVAATATVIPKNINTLLTTIDNVK